MGHGTPVVTSNTSSLPEAAGGAALLVNPENVFEIRRGLQRVLLDPVLRARMKQRGYEQAQRFSWTSSVSRILEIYREVAGHQCSPALAAAPGWRAARGGPPRPATSSPPLRAHGTPHTPSHT